MSALSPLEASTSPSTPGISRAPPPTNSPPPAAPPADASPFSFLTSTSASSNVTSSLIVFLILLGCVAALYVTCFCWAYVVVLGRRRLARRRKNNIEDGVTAPQMAKDSASGDSGSGEKTGIHGGRLWSSAVAGSTTKSKSAVDEEAFGQMTIVVDESGDNAGEKAPVTGNDEPALSS